MVKKKKKKTEEDFFNFDEEKIEMNKEMAIRDSKMTEEQKEYLLEKIGVIEKKKESGIPFNVYARIKNINKGLHEAMLVFPRAKGVKLATIKEWDSIFRDF